MSNLGLSGDQIIFSENNVKKVCKSNQERFIKNIDKQKKFISNNIIAVPIIDHGMNELNEYYVNMPHLKCDNAMIWISKASTEHIYMLEVELISYFKNLIDNSSLVKFDTNAWTNKISELQAKIADDDLQNVLHHMKNIQTKELFYEGDYHGDFTLTNLFIHSDNDKINIEAIDFLHSFMHSPINDLVKIRQDTFCLWTLHLINDFSVIDVNRVLILLKYIDNKLEGFIQSNPILKEYYLPFQIINLIRIVPYNTNDKIFNYLKEEIMVLFNKFMSQK